MKQDWPVSALPLISPVVWQCPGSRRFILVLIVIEDNAGELFIVMSKKAAVFVQTFLYTVSA